MVRIRMQRLGRTHRPFYRINAVDVRTKRDGKVIERLGWYNPVEPDPEKQIELNAERIKDWLDRGAQPSETVMDILGKREMLGSEMKAKWIADREIALRRGRCKIAIKSIEAAVKGLDTMAKDDADAIKPHGNIAKRSLNDAKRTIPRGLADEAEAFAKAATDALGAAKKSAEAAKAKAEAEKPAEEAPAAE